ncbi:hypothetical protein KIPB_010457, partial [Kipferlia bialata]|eukprot:g10457.t1
MVSPNINGGKPHPGRLFLTPTTISRLTRTPEDQLSSVTELHLRQGHDTDRVLERLEELECVPKLRTFVVSGHLLASLSGIACLQRLTLLDVSHNRLTSLQGVGALPYLKVLRASHNRLSSLTAVPKAMTSSGYTGHASPGVGSPPKHGMSQSAMRQSALSGGDTETGALLSCQ